MNKDFEYRDYDKNPLSDNEVADLHKRYHLDDYDPSDPNKEFDDDIKDKHGQANLGRMARKMYHSDESLTESDQVVWSSNGTRDYISGMSDEEKFNALVDRGYDPEMLGSVENIDDVIADDNYMWQDDSDEFGDNIVPMINDQTRDGLVIMVNENGDGKVVYAENLVCGDIDPTASSVEIIDDGKGLIWKSDNGNEYMLFAIPEDDEQLRQFVGVCLPEYAHYIGEDDDDGEEIIDTIINRLGSYGSDEILSEFCDFTKVGSVCPRIQNMMNESINEEKINEASTKNRDGLEKEVEEIKPLANDYGFEFFTSMPFSNYDNDEQSVEYQYPEFAKIVKSFFKEMGIIDAENINDVDELDDNWFNLDQHDWDTIIEVCNRLVEQGGSHQFEKIYKNGYNSPIDDEQVLADREVQDDEFVDESLTDEGLNMDKLRNKLMALKDEPIEEDTFTKLPRKKRIKESGETFFEPWDHDGNEEINSAIYLYSQDYDGTPESLQDIENDLRDHYFYDDSDEEFIQAVLNGIKEAPINEGEESKDDEYPDAELAQTFLGDIIGTAYKARPNDKIREEDEMEEKSIEDELAERLAKAAEKYKNYAGLVDEELTEELDDYAANRACHEFNLSKEELKGALGK